MDNSVSELKIINGKSCNYCSEAKIRLNNTYFPNRIGEKKLENYVIELKARNRNKKYDVIVGLSGGIDSAYLAYLLKEKYGLRLLAIHVDAGWNNVIAVGNIEKLLRALGIDLHTEVIEWEKMRKLQLAFLHAGVLNQDIPQDHAFFATLYRFCSKLKLNDFASGVNIATESIEQKNDAYPSIDGRHLHNIYKAHYNQQLKNFPIMTLYEYILRTRFLKSPRITKPLNWLAYSKDEAKNKLKDYFDWEDYGEKHTESIFTKFYQEIYLPERYNFDKRRLHLSSLIASGEISRDKALEELKNPIINKESRRLTLKYVAKKLQISNEKLEDLIQNKRRKHSDYKSDMWIIKAHSKINNLLWKAR